MRRVQGAIIGAALAAALGASLPAAASASDPGLLLDCSDGVVDGDYTRAELRQAQGDVPADSSEYGECGAALSAALAATAKSDVKGKAASNGEPGGGDSSSAADTDGDGTVTSAERKAAKDKRAEAERDKREIRELASADPVPSLAVDETSEDGGLPTPLLLALIALVTAGGAGGLWYLTQHNERFAAALRRLRN